MKKAIIFLFLMIIMGSLLSAQTPPDTLWTKTFGGIDSDEAYSVQQTTDGGYIVAGHTFSYGEGQNDFWLIKTDADGNEMWNQTYGGSEYDYAYSVQQTTDGGYIVAGRTLSYGSRSYDAYLIKTDSIGDTLWTKTFGGIDHDEVFSVWQTTDGGYTIAGNTSSYGPGDTGLLLIKTDENGNEEWYQTYDGSIPDYAKSIQQTIDEGYIIAGKTNNYGAGSNDFWLIRLKPADHIINIPSEYPTIQEGIIAAGDADTVLVQPGTYIENINFNGKNITVGSLFLTTQDTSYISQTIINGNQNGHVVTFANEEDSTSVFSGFTVTNGDFGIRVWNPSTVLDEYFPKIDHVRVIDNNDCGLYIYYSSPILTNIIIHGNTSQANGGGLFFQNSNSNLDNILIRGNSVASSGYYGGGIYCGDSEITLTNVEITDNWAGDGGGIWMDYSNATLYHCLISDNIAFEDGYNNGTGGGIYCGTSGSVSLNKVTLCNNSAELGGSIHGYGAVVITINNCISWGNTPQEIFSEINAGSYPILNINYSDVQGGEYGIYGNTNGVTWSNSIDADPLFSDPTNGDYHLQWGSPCINTGDPNSPLDPDGTRADMGCYYFDHTPSADFIGNPLILYPYTEVNFTDQSIGIITEWFWDFQNDGIYDSYEQNPTFTYTDAGIYSVKLKVSDGTNVDSLIQHNYITVEYVPPASPTNVQIEITNDDAVISWAEVDTTIFGTMITPDGYIVLINEDPYTDFIFLSFTPDTTYTHTYVGQYIDQMFYRFVAVINLSREEIKYLLSLNNSRDKVKWSDVKRNFNVIRK